MHRQQHQNQNQTRPNPIYIYICMYTRISLSLSLYIDIYIERERDVYIYIYIHTYGSVYFACDHGKHRNAERYVCGSNLLSSPPCPKSYTQNRTVEQHIPHYRFITQTNLTNKEHIYSMRHNSGPRKKCPEYATKIYTPPPIIVSSV